MQYTYLPSNCMQRKWAKHVLLFFSRLCKWWMSCIVKQGQTFRCENSWILIMLYVYKICIHTRSRCMYTKNISLLTELVKE